MKTNNEIINTLLEQVQPAFESYWERQLQKIKDRFESDLIKKQQNPRYFMKVEQLTDLYIEREKASYFDGLTFDLIKALGKYLKKTDKLDKHYTPSFKMGKVGFQVSLFVERDDVKHFFRTEAIYAGGYNIQCLHIRYLAHTDLPCLLNNEPLVYLTNTQKIEEHQNYIKNVQERIQNILLQKDVKGEWTYEVWTAKENRNGYIPNPEFRFKQHQNWCKRGYLTDIKKEEKEIAKYQVKIDKWNAEINK